MSIDWIFPAGQFQISYKTVRPVFRKFCAIKKMRNFFFANNFKSMCLTDMLCTPIDWIFQAGHFDISYKTVRPVFRKFCAIKKMRNFFFCK